MRAKRSRRSSATPPPRAAVEATAAVYRKTPKEQIAADLQSMMATLFAVAHGQTPPLGVQPMDLGAYAPHMTAPHRIDLLVSAMVKDGAWHCNQKCLHCYAARQPYGAVEELDTDQWLAVIQKCRAAGVPQLTFTGGEPTLRHDLVKLVDAAQWFVTRLNTNGRMLTPALCRELYEASLDSVQVTLYSADEATHNTLVGAAGFADTVAGIRSAVEAGLNVSVNTPLCSLNRDYAATLTLAHSLGVRYATCSGLIPAGARREHGQPRHPPDARRTGRCAAHRAGRRRPLGHGTGFHKPRLAGRRHAARVGLCADPALRGVPVQHGHCAGRHRTALPELAARPGAGQHPAPAVAAHLGFADLPPHPPPKRQNAPRLPAGVHPDPKGGQAMSEQTPLRRAARLCAAAAAALLLCLAAAWLCPARADLDRIRSYTVTVDPRADGSADITYDIDWEVIGGSAEEPLSWVRIGLANGEVDSFENLTPETVSGVRYSGDGGGSFARVTFKKRYYPPDYAAASGQESRVQFAFRVHQSQLYTLNEDGTASYVFTPGWFSDLSIDEMTVRWRADEGVTADATDSEDGYFVWRFGALGHDARATVRVRVPAAAAAAFDPAAALPAAGQSSALTDLIPAFVTLVVVLLAVYALVLAARSHPRWRGGFGSAASDWVFYTNGLHTIHLARGLTPPPGYRPAPPPPGFKAGGGQFRGGGAGKSDSGHNAGCACACACVSCACACACAGGGRAGCSAKNFYRITMADGGNSDEH